MSGPHRAQVNVALGPLDDPVMAGFVALLDEVDAFADTSPGSVWRLQDEVGEGRRRLDLPAAAGPTKDAFASGDLFDSQGEPF